jgi:hypothetical protein
MQQGIRDKNLKRFKGASIFEEGQDNGQDLQEDSRAGGHEANSQKFH